MILYLALIKSNDVEQSMVIRGDKERFFGNIENMTKLASIKIVHQVHKSVNTQEDEAELWANFVNSLCETEDIQLAESKFHIWLQNAVMIWLVYKDSGCLCVFPKASNRMIPCKKKGEHQYKSFNRPMSG